MFLLSHSPIKYVWCLLSFKPRSNIIAWYLIKPDEEVAVLLAELNDLAFFLSAWITTFLRLPGESSSADKPAEVRSGWSVVLSGFSGKTLGSVSVKRTGGVVLSIEFLVSPTFWLISVTRENCSATFWKIWKTSFLGGGCWWCCCWSSWIKLDGVTSKFWKDLTSFVPGRRGVVDDWCWSMLFRSSCIDGLLEGRMTFCGVRLENRAGRGWCCCLRPPWWRYGLTFGQQSWIFF